MSVTLLYEVNRPTERMHSHPPYCEILKTPKDQAAPNSNRDMRWRQKRHINLLKGCVNQSYVMC